MTSERIRDSNPTDRPGKYTSTEQDRNFWLKEIAYQLAVMNERAVPIDFVPGGTRPMDDFQKGQNR